jgi:hypothetical protein
MPSRVGVTARGTEHVIPLTNLPVAPVLAAVAAVDHVRSTLRRVARGAVVVDGVVLRPPLPAPPVTFLHLRTATLHSIGIRRLLRPPDACGRWRPLTLKLVVDRDPMSIAPPAILTAFHTEPNSAFMLLMASLPGAKTVLTGRLKATKEIVNRVADGVVVVGIAEGDDLNRSAALHAAAKALRAGGFVLLHGDGWGSARVPTTVLGREFSMSRGAFALSRLTGAAVVPLASRWEQGRPYVSIGEPIAAGSVDEMAAALASWLDGYLRERPGELTSYLNGLLRLERSPRRRWLTAILAPSMKAVKLARRARRFARRVRRFVRRVHTLARGRPGG